MTEPAAFDRSGASSSTTVRGLRKRLGVSQTEFARRCGCAITTVRQWEYGRRQPNAAARARLEAIASGEK